MRLERVRPDVLVPVPALQHQDLPRMTAAVYEGAGRQVHLGPVGAWGWFVVWDDHGTWCAGDSLIHPWSPLAEPTVVERRPGSPVRVQRTDHEITLIADPSEPGATLDYTLAPVSPQVACLVRSSGHLVAAFDRDESLTLSDRASRDDVEMTYFALGSGLVHLALVSATPHARIEPTELTA